MWLPRIGPELARDAASIVNALAADVASGALADGDRLPPQRALAEKLGVAHATVARAYTLARTRGLVRGEIGRGTFVRHASVERARDLRNGVDRIERLTDLGTNFPIHPQASDEAEFRTELQALAGSDCILHLQAHPENIPAHHLDACRGWIARYGVEGDLDVSICAGPQHALSTALAALCSPGDVILTETTTCPGLLAAAELRNLRVVGVETDRDGLVPGALDEACRRVRPRLLFTSPTLHSPSTRTTPPARRERLARICERHDVLVVEDESGSVPPREPASAMQTWAPQRTVLLVSSYRYVFPGLRIAWLAAPRRLAAAIDRAVRQTIWVAPPLTAEIASRWLRDGLAEATARSMGDRAAARMRVLRHHADHAELRWREDSVFCWLGLPSPWRSEQFAARAMQQGVLVRAANHFGAGSHHGEEGIRISLLSAQDDGAFARAAATLGRLLERA